MPYRHETCRAGKTKQHTFYYATRTDTKEGSRRQKENKTSETKILIVQACILHGRMKRINAQQGKRNYGQTLTSCFGIFAKYIKRRGTLQSMYGWQRWGRGERHTSTWY